MTLTVLTAIDKSFVQKAAMGNQFEIEAAKLAQTMSMDAKVKAYSHKIITDCTKRGADVKAAVKKADPATMVAATVSPAQQQLLGALKAGGKISTLFTRRTWRPVTARPTHCFRTIRRQLT